jgi:hypothetical protein
LAGVECPGADQCPDARPAALPGHDQDIGRDFAGRRGGHASVGVGVPLEAGIIERDANKKLLVPFKQIRIEADLFSDDTTKAA